MPATAIQVSDVRRTFAPRRGLVGPAPKTVEALTGLSFAVGEGEIFGLVGPNGAGKTTTIKILTTLLVPTSGTARVLGFDVVADTNRLRSQINVVFGGDRGLYWRLSAWDNLRYFADLYRVPRRVQKTLLEELLSMVGLMERARDRVETFSRGMKQRLHLARGLLNDPRVLFLDEPTIGLDPAAAASLRAIVLVLRQRGKTIVLTTHYMHEVEQLCDRVAIINRGRLVALDRPEAVRRRAQGLAVLEVCVDRLPEGAEAGLRSLPAAGAVAVEARDLKWYVSVQTPDPQQITQAALEVFRPARVLDIRTREASLEDAYLYLVGRDGMAPC